MGHKILGGAKKIELEKGQTVDVKLSVEYMSFSAHADAKGIMQLIQHCEPRAVMLVHGEAEKMRFLRAQIRHELNLDCHCPANGETCSIPTPARVPVDASLALLKAEATRFAATPPDPKRRRRLHGVLVLRDGKASLVGAEEACKEAGIARHVIRFTSGLRLRDPAPALATAHKLCAAVRERLPGWPVSFADGAIAVESVLVKVEGEDEDEQKHVYVSWTNQDEDLGSFIWQLLSAMAR